MQRLRRAINSAAPVVLLTYFLIGIMAYVNVWPGSARLFASSSMVGILARVFSTFLICSYSVCFGILNRQRISLPWKWLIPFVFVLVVNFVTMLATPHSFIYFYTSSLYSRLHEVSISTGYKTLFTFYLSSISDFAIGFCFMFLLPHAFKTKKQLLLILVPFIGFMMLEVVYSLIKERGAYLEIFTKDAATWGGYNISIGATFGDKQEFGAFLTLALCASLVVFSALDVIQHKPIRMLFRAVDFVCIFVFFAITFFTLCKTAIIANSAAIICTSIGFFVFLRKRSRLLFYFILGLVFLTLTAVVLILSVDAFHQDGALAKFYHLVDTLFLKRVNQGIFSRFYLVRDFFGQLNLANFLFGFSKGGLTSYMRLATVEGQSALHTGFIYFQGCYGMFGSALYFALFFMVTKSIVRLSKKALFLGAPIVGCFLASCIFNLSENEVLILSGSGVIFLFNLTCVIFPKGYLLDEQN